MIKLNITTDSKRLLVSDEKKLASKLNFASECSFFYRCNGETTRGFMDKLASDTIGNNDGIRYCWSS